MSTTRMTTEPESSQIVPGWKGLLDRLDSKDERIEQLEEEVERLESRLEEFRDCEEGEADGPTRAEVLVAELRRTAE